MFPNGSHVICCLKAEPRMSLQIEFDKERRKNQNVTESQSTIFSVRQQLHRLFNGDGVEIFPFDHLSNALQ